MARAARDRRVFFVEEPVREPAPTPHLRLVDRAGLIVVTPILPPLDGGDPVPILRDLIDHLVATERIDGPVLWYVTPMALPWTRHLDAAATVYDSMDYLPGFRGAPPGLLELEDELLGRADLVFAGGASLHRRMAGRHPSAHCFPSSVDLAHFRAARSGLAEPADQAAIPRPRVGYAGVIDERIDLDLIDGVAAARPEIELVLVGPIAKIDAADIPARPNIDRLGMKPYAELPAYLGGWDVGWMPFARNDATRYISPTKTPEYLAAGLPVVSTSIHDVVEPYGIGGLVTIADTVDATVAAIDAAVAGRYPSQEHVDAFLATTSWDRTWAAMARLIDERTGDRVARSVLVDAPQGRDARPGRAAVRRTRALRPSLVDDRATRRAAVTLASRGSSPDGTMTGLRGDGE
jgi:UDP-galactopyranose mutase